MAGIESVIEPAVDSDSEMHFSPNSTCGGESDRLPEVLLRRVTRAVGIPRLIAPSLEGLSSVYSAWCGTVPFDNMRKMIARATDGAEMPGLDAADYFEYWLEHGVGGTCWPSSNALFVLLGSLGFDVRRVAGSMFDLGVMNHGTVKVRIDGEDWLADTSMMTNAPLPVGDALYFSATVEVEPDGDSHVVSADFVPLSVYVPCRLHLDSVDNVYYVERYKIFSREQSPFNSRLYFRKGGRDGTAVILGNTRFKRTDGVLESKEFSRDGLCEYLAAEGVSEALLGKWVDRGGLEMSFNPANIGASPEITGVRPSLRTYALSD